MAAAKWIQIPAGDLYGKTLPTDLLERLRPDERFDSLDALVAQMALDKARAREVLGHDQPSPRREHTPARR